MKQQNPLIAACIENIRQQLANSRIIMTAKTATPAQAAANVANRQLHADFIKLVQDFDPTMEWRAARQMCEQAIKAGK